MNNEPINEIASHKHLGIFLSNDGTWHEHIHYITSKAWTRLHIMRKLKFIYTSFIRPILEYADVVWDNCTQYEINAVEKIQIEAARIVTGTSKLVSLEKLYNETCWETLERRRQNINYTYCIKCLIILRPIISPLLFLLLLKVHLLIGYEMRLILGMLRPEPNRITSLFCPLA